MTGRSTRLWFVRFLCSVLAVTLAATAALAADATGTWKWHITTSDDREVETTVKIAMQAGKLAGTYQNEFGETPIKDVTFKDDVLAFAVDREVGGKKFTLKFRGKIDGDVIKGEHESHGVAGPGGKQKKEWSARRVKDGAQQSNSADPSAIPRTWDDAAVANLELPLANPPYSPVQVSSEYYYRMPVRPIYKSYPIYPMDKEPAGYLDWLKQHKPEIVFDAEKLHTKNDWIRAGKLVFEAAANPTPLAGNPLRDPSRTAMRAILVRVTSEASLRPTSPGGLADVLVSFFDFSV